MSDVAADVLHLPGTSFFNERGGLVVARLAEVIRAAGHVRVGADGRLWRYDAGAYVPDGETFARAQVRETLGDRVARKHFEEVLTWLRSFPPSVDAGHPVTRWVNVRNGLLDWRTGELHPHSPDVVSTAQLPVAWNPDATCPRTAQFFAESLPEDALEFIAEVFGYAIYGGSLLRRAVLLLGSGGNGKSVLLDDLKALLGHRNVSSEPLQRLSEHRFAVAELFGKLANVCGDLDARAVKQSDIFKMLTGGDSVPAERKYGHGFSFTSHALLVFSANEPPISSDQTQAWFDRWLIVPMERRFEGSAGQDPHLRDKLTTPAELEGLLVLAVNGLRRLMARGRFEEPASVREAGSQYRDKLDTARGFVADSCVIRGDAWVPRAALYKAYRQWCVDSGRLPVSAETFNSHVRSNHAGQVGETTRRGTRGWQGIGLVTDGHEPLTGDDG